MTIEVLEQQAKRIEELEAILAGLSYRHGLCPDLGPCVCKWHLKAREALNQGESAPPKESE